MDWGICPNRSFRALGSVQHAAHQTSSRRWATPCARSRSGPRDHRSSGRTDTMAHHRLTILLAHLLLVALVAAPAAAQAPRLIHAASRLQHGSGAGSARDVALPLEGASGIEPRAVGKGMTLVLTFDRPLASRATAAVAAGTATISGTPTVSRNTMSVALTGVADRQEVALSVSGYGGGRDAKPLTVRFRTLQGDVDADGTVSRQDLSAVMTTAGRSTDGSNFRADTDASGSVSAADVNHTRGRLGGTVAGGAAADKPPTVGSIPPQQAYSGRASTSVGFAVGDAESHPDALFVRATSSDPTLLPDEAITLGGSGSTRAIYVTPAAGRTGKATVTLSVSDGLTSSSASYELTVLPPPTLYIARMAPQAGVQSLGSGQSTLLLAGDELSAVVRFNYSNLSSPETSKHVHGPAGPGQDGGVLLDLDPPFPPNVTANADGSYTWTFVPAGNVTVAQIVDAIKTGRTYINIHSSNYPSGEIRGQYFLVNGSQTFQPPPPPPALPGGPPTATDTARFLK